MKAMRYHEYGGPEVLRYEEILIPEVGPDEVLIRVAATSFNPIDNLFRKGLMKDRIPITLPFTPGSDVSGLIEKTGTEVDKFQHGDRVFAFVNTMQNGAAAEYVICKAVDVALAPLTIGLQDAAALAATGTTAWQALFVHGNLQPGQRVLITAAAGGVGSLAVQLAKGHGAYVLGSCSEASASLVKSLGADETIDYQKESVLTRVHEPVDMIFNLAPTSSDDLSKMLGLLKKGGILVSAAQAADGDEAQRLGVRTLRMAVQRNADHLARIAELVDQGALRPVVTARVPLGDLAVVHAQAGQTRGKVLIVVDETL